MCYTAPLQIKVTASYIEVGAGITLTRLQDLLLELVKTQPAHRTRGFAAAVEQLRWFAGRQIRNVGTLGGNIATASPISDLNPLWMAFNAVFKLVAQGRRVREVPASKFFLAYRCAASASAQYVGGLSQVD